MPYKDPEKRREMGRVYWATYAATEKGQAARLASREAWAARNPERVKAAMAVRALRYRQTHPDPYRGADEKTRARAAVRRALVRGVLERGPCEVCGVADRINAHHYLGYSVEHRLDVRWLLPIVRNTHAGRQG